jgi:hypothetical protein
VRHSPRLRADEHSGFWDTAVRGSSALQAALAHALNDELAVARGYEAVAVHFDLGKLRDTISLRRSRIAAESVSFPALTLLISLQSFLGRLALTAGGTVAAPILPTSSMGAGCRRANALARVMLA